MNDDIKVGLTLDGDNFSIQVTKAAALLREFRATAETSSKSIQNAETSTGNFGARLRWATTEISMARGALANLNDLFLGIPRLVANASGEIERMQKLMQGLARSSQDVVAGNKSVAKTSQEWTQFVFNMSKTAPFEVNAISDSFVKLKTAGLDPTDGSLKALVDSVAKFGGTSESLKRASVAIQQMGGKGVISMEELRQQLGEAVPDAMQNMAQGAGMSMAEFVKAVSKGTVESKSALKNMFTVMQQNNSGSAATMMDSWVGQIARLKTEATLFLNEVGNAGQIINQQTGEITKDNSFFGEIKKQLKEINDQFGGKEAKAYAANIGSSLSDVTKSIGAGVKAVVEFGHEIKIAGELMVAFFAANKAVSIGGDIKKAFSEQQNAFSTFVKNKIEQEKAAIADSYKLKAQEITQQRDLAVVELAQQKERHAALLLEARQARALQAEAEFIGANGYRPAGSITGRPGTKVSVEDIKINRDLVYSYNEAARAAETSAARMSAAMVKNGEVIGGVTNALRVNTENYQGAITKATGGISGMIAKVPGLGAAIGLLGGPVGIITTLLAVGATAWFNWGKEAQEAIRAADRAISEGMANRVDQSSKKAQRDAQQNYVDSLEKQNRDSKDPVLAGTVLPVDPKILQQAKDRLKQFNEDLSKASAQAERNELNDTVRRNAQNVQVRIDLITAAQSRRRDAENAAYGLAVKDAVANQKDVQELEKKHQQTLSQIGVDGARQRLDHITASQKIVADLLAKGDFSKYTKKSLEAQNENLLQKRNQASSELSDAELVGKVGILASKKATPNGNASTYGQDTTAIQKFIDRLKEQQSQLDSTREAILANRQATHDYLAEFNDKLDEGKFKTKAGGDPTAQQIEEGRAEAIRATAAAKENANLKTYSSLLENLTSKVTNLKGSLTDTSAEGQVQEFMRQIEKMRTNGLATDKLEELTASVKEFKSSMLDAEINDAIKTTESNIAGMAAELAGGTKEAGKLEYTLARLKAQAQTDDQKDAILRLTNDIAETNRLTAEKAEREVTLRASKKLQEIRQLNATEAEIVRARYQEEVNTVEAAYAKISDIEKSSLKVQEAHRDEIAAATARMAEGLKSPARKMVDQWENATDQMKKASANWTTSTIDEMVNMAETGKFSFSTLIDSMLKDILRITYQKQFGGAIQNVMDSVADTVGGLIGGNKQKDAGVIMNLAADSAEKMSKALEGSASKAGDFTESVADSAAGAIKQATESQATSTSLGFMGSAATAAANALNTLASSAGGASAASGDDSGDIFGAIGDFLGFGGSGGGDGYEALPSFVDASGTGSSGGGWMSAISNFFGFADGGIMTKYGSAQLRKYEKGGIANTPQIALFGEGKGAEAYVPLPDGRSIPVTMSGSLGMGGGSQAAPVTVNLIGAPEGTQVKQSQDANGGLTIDILLQQVEGKMAQNVAKGKGQLTTAIEKTYGLNRAAGAY